MSDTQTTTQVSQVSYSGLSGTPSYSYTYDALGYIATYTAPDGEVITYTYDAQGQLLEAAGDTTYTYTYDGFGNLKTANGHSYTYGNAQWRDLLTAYDGQSISYDGSGNPTSYYNGTRWTFEWAEGRNLVKAIGGGHTVTYAYDHNGVRTSKTVDGTAHTYYYASGKLLRETYGSNTLDFFYDASGTPFALKHNGTMYYYITNLQGDVMQLVNASGAVVASYEYDPFGNIISSSGELASINPLRYRGYYFDQETQLYYLQSRYYDPQVGRFINADTYVASGSTIIDHNMFAYCGNNPVMGYDPTGEWDFGTFFEGVSLLSIGIIACTTAAAVVTGGACTPLLVVATATFVAGGMTAVNGAAEVAESFTDYNVVRDGIYGGDVAYYEAQKEVFAAAAEIGTAALGMATQNPGLCFVAGTMVLLEEGAKDIESIEPGDLVWAWDEETGDVALKKVVETYVNETSELVHVFVNGEEIVTTPAHPFYSPVKGWTDAVHLRAGDILVLVNGEYVVVERVQHELLEAPVTVYNFQVQDYHTYYVSDVGILVHNSCDYKPLRDGDMRAVINPGELEAPHAHVFQKSNNIGRIFSNGTMDASLLNNRDGMRFVKNHYDEIIALIGDFYGKR